MSSIWWVVVALVLGYTLGTLVMALMTVSARTEPQLTNTAKERRASQAS